MNLRKEERKNINFNNQIVNKLVCYTNILSVGSKFIIDNDCIL